ncbi:VWA domain-containing protein [Tunturibacter empetritectus]|nr:VWA domain-containing protein [Edaphobacter lichenicola]
MAAAAGWLLLMAGGAAGWAQRPASPQTSSPQTTSQPPAKQQPASQQPSLTVDRDPVASPDPDLPAQSQTGAPQGVGAGTIARENGKYTLRQDAYEVRLNATVLDGSGRSVQTLDRDAFHIYEDGVPQTINSFRHEDLPVSLGLLIDSSGSMYDKRQAVDKASLDFVKLSNPEDEEFLVDFSWEAFIDQDFTNNIDKLQQGLGYIKSSGGTAIYDALVASADYLAKNAKHPKQVLLVITDGEDNASSATLEQTIRRIQDLDGPVIYCVGLLFGEDTDKRESRHARRVLETLAEQTGGAAYFPKSVKDVDAIAAEVAQDIRTQYTISYHSTKSPTLGGYREVHVEAKSKNFGRLSVRTRTGYYPRVVADASKGGSAGFSDPGKKN